MPSIKSISAFIGMSITLALGSPRIPQGALSISLVSSPFATATVDGGDSDGLAKRACSIVTLYGAQDTIITTKCDLPAATCTPCVGCNAPQCEERIDMIQPGVQWITTTKTAAEKIIPTPVESVTTSEAAVEKVGPTPV